MLVVLLLGLAGFVGYKFYHRQKFLRHLRMAKISVDELKRRLDAGSPSAWWMSGIRWPSIWIPKAFPALSTLRWKTSSIGITRSRAIATSCSTAAA